MIIEMDIIKVQRLNKLSDWVYNTGTNDNNFMAFVKSFNGIDESYYPLMISPYLYSEHIFRNVMNIDDKYITYERIVSIANCIVDTIECDYSIDIQQMTQDSFRELVIDATVFHYC